MGHNLTPDAVSRRIAYENRRTAEMVVEDMIDRGATVEAEGRLCKHVWKVDLQAFVKAGLKRVSLRFQELPCPVCGEVSWPNYTLRDA